MSKVIHARLNESTIVGCYKLLRENGVSTAGMPMSTVVARTIEAVINGLVDAGELERLSETRAVVELEALLNDQDVAGMRLSINPSFLSYGDQSEPETAEEEHQRTFEEDVNEQLDQEEPEPIEEEQPLYGPAAEDAVKEILEAAQRHGSQKGVEDFERDDVDDTEEEPEPPLSPIPPWEEEGILSWDEIEAEEDEIVKLATDARPAYQRAVQVVYSKIPREMRGTKKALELVEQTLPIVQRYIQAGYV